MKKKVYIGPLWGQYPLLAPLMFDLNEFDVTFYGGYAHFTNGEKKVFDFLLTLPNKYQFNSSRFEECFFVITGQSPEKNFHFKRWLNPFSGILSQLEVYGMDLDLFMKDPENASSLLMEQLKKTGHIHFFEKLKKALIPDEIEKKIEESILNRSAFRTLTIYRDDGSIYKEIEREAGFLDKYIQDTLKQISLFENKYD